MHRVMPLHYQSMANDLNGSVPLGSKSCCQCQGRSPARPRVPIGSQRAQHPLN